MACISDFATFYERHGPSLKHYLMRRTSHPHDAEDAFQEMCLELHCALERGKAVSERWAYRVAYHALVDCIHDSNHSSPAGLLYTVLDSFDELEQREKRNDLEELFRMVSREVERLRPSYRDALKRAYGRSMSPLEIADELSIHRENAKSRVHRGLKKLRRKLTSPKLR